MSALTVERLVGNTTNRGYDDHDHVTRDTAIVIGRRMTMSPDTSDNVSESSVTSNMSLGRDREREYHLNNNNNCAVQIVKSNRISPSRYSKIQLLLGNDDYDRDGDDENEIGEEDRFRERMNGRFNRRPEQNSGTTTTTAVEEVIDVISEIKKEEESIEERISVGGGILIVDEKTGSGDNNGIGRDMDTRIATFRTSAPLLTQKPELSSPPLQLSDDGFRDNNKSVDNNNGLDSSDEQKGVVLIVAGAIGHGPPSRPSSSASENSSSSCFISSPSPPKIIITQPQSQSQTHHPLPIPRKFSISDILRPDFGQNAIQRIQERLQQEAKVNNRQNHHRMKSNPNVNGNASDSNSNNTEKETRRIKNHSEDSNSSCTSSTTTTSGRREVVDESKVNPAVPKGPLLWPAWVYCTRYSDRPSSGPRSRRIRKPNEGGQPPEQPEEKRPRTAFTAEQLGRLKHEFEENRYLTEKRRQDLARDLKLHENQIKIWFQNKRAKLKKSNGQRGGLAIQLMAQGLYNHSTVPMDEDEEDYIPC